MEKKPIKRNEHIVMLSKDHHFMLLFCWKIRNGLKQEAEPERIKKYVQYFWQHFMQPHFKEEENLLFSLVKNEAVQRALQEHAQITQQIKAVTTAKNVSAEQLSELADTVDLHVRYEERELFPHLEKVLTDKQLNHIGEQLALQHNPDLKDDFGDEFWLKQKNGL